MAVLTDAGRRARWARFMRENTEAVSISKVELRAAVDALDAFMDANEAAVNSAIPQPARGALSVKQKASLLMHVVSERYEVI